MPYMALNNLCNLHLSLSKQNNNENKYIGRTYILSHDFHWNPRAVMLPTLSSLVAPHVVVDTRSGAISDVKVGTMKTLAFQCL